MSQREHRTDRTTETRSAPSRGQSPAERSELLEVQRTLGNAAALHLLRRAGEAREEAPEQPAVQRSAVHDVLNGSGRPLAASLRAEMESRLGADFSDVRVHDDAAARASAAGVGARAYTSGHHVVIGDGGGDKHTLAHELTHVIQQRQGPVSGSDNGSGLRVSDPSDRFERAAEANAHRVMRGAAPAAHESHAHEHAHTAGDGVVQRAPEQTMGRNIAAGLGQYGTQIGELAARIGTTSENVINALLDPAYDPMGAHDIAPEILDSNLKDPIEYAACFPTAHDLFPVLTDPAVNPARQGPNPERAADIQEFQAAVRTLTGSIQEAWSEGLQSVFRIEYAGHGFTLVIRIAEDQQPHIELIESLAHAAGITTSLSNAPGMTVEHVLEALTAMSSGDVTERVRGAGLLGWNAHALYLGDPQPTEQERFPQTRMKWWRQPLSPQAGDNWHAQFVLRFNFVAGTYGTTQLA
ncbi:eCIS core domain-containing protein [Streptomyces sp. NBC_00441]|uniref:eCIS core domain-containing protein n=1 Tax=Streptomyces sp. NBC_00441 TaxID=2975742 RepID=UPI003FCC476E